MADWYEVEEDSEITHVRATNTRTAFDKGFRLLCGTDFKVQPGRTLTLKVLRLRGGSDVAKTLEKFYQETRKNKKPVRDASALKIRDIVPGAIQS